MKTDASLTKCLLCKTSYSPDNCEEFCPHKSRSESALLKKLREKGKPYVNRPSLSAGYKDYAECEGQV